MRISPVYRQAVGLFFLFLIENMAQFLQTPARQAYKQPFLSPDSAHRVNCIYEKNFPPGETVPEKNCLSFYLESQAHIVSKRFVYRTPFFSTQHFIIVRNGSRW
jgi:hypothetical protein